MKFGSLFSGIEAASLAWHSLGWKTAFVAEIEPFPAHVLNHRFGTGRPEKMPAPEAAKDEDERLSRIAAIKAVQDLPSASVEAPANLGDVMRDDIIERVRSFGVNALIGGPPCQDYSVAGLRAGLAGERGNLSLRYAEIINGVKNDDGFIFAATENVPGWLSANKGLAFGTYLAKLVESSSPLIPPRSAGGRWTDAGMVDGPGGRVAWRILDAQYFGLAQRRRRVFAIFCPRNGFDPAEILFEYGGVRRDSPPCHETGEIVAALTANGVGTCGADDNQGQAGHLNQMPGLNIAGTIEATAGRSRGAGTPPSMIVMATGQGNAEVSEGLRPSLTCNHEAPIIAHTLRGEGFDASEDGTGRGIPLVPMAFHSVGDGDDCDINSPTIRAHDPMAVVYPILEPGARTGKSTTDPRAGIGIGNSEDPMFTLQAGKQHGIAVSLRGRDGGATAELTEGAAPALRASQGGGDKPHVLTSAVRRLLPHECERLQGATDHWTRIPYRGKPAEDCPDGPRYKAIGNSKAVPVVRWLGKRVQKLL